VDRASIEALYRKYGPAVLRRARAILGEEQAARDAMQEVFIRALKAEVEFEGVSPMTWLYRVTTNYCLNVRRDRVRRTKLLDIHGPKDETAPGSQDERVSVLELLNQVPLELAQIAVYYYLDQMNQDEIAEVVGVSRRTIGNRLEEFRRLARAALGEALEVTT
jgi:RNA polymerase sigma-70 factor (ECF subfamily)